MKPMKNVSAAAFARALASTLPALTLLHALAVHAQPMPTVTPPEDRSAHANRYDRAVAGRYEAREADWRNGPIVYQVLVDRFAPSADLEAKRALYPAPKRLLRWDQPPTRGTYLRQERVWSHEIDFWGGDLASTRSRLDHVQQLGADVLYLNPIHLAWTNHKYDALDYQAVSPEFGTRDDVRALAADVHRRGMKLVLDGVFNHMGRNAPIFQQALAANEAHQRAAAGGRGGDGSAPAADAAGSDYRHWFVFGPQFQYGYRGWWNVGNLPELNLEHPPVREHIWEGPDSVVRSYLRDGVDGWRLDVAFDIGFNHLEALTRAAQAEKPGALVVGELPNYPREWFPSVDGVMHFGLRKLMIATANRQLPGPDFTRMVARLVADADYEHLLKSWVYLDNHDTPRLATTVRDAKARRLAQVLQFTLPGAVNLYYGSEVGMTGGEDPEMRGPMRWDRVEAGHPELAWTRQLVALRKAHRALRVGDFRPLEASGPIVAYMRHTDRAGDAVLVLVNPTLKAVDTTVLVSDSKLMDGDNLVDQLGGAVVQLQAALIMTKMPPQTAWVLTPRLVTEGGYSNFKRVQ
jgi:cyclomaltodextrinase / maltogenic alpha-amylase / neopullulanase